MICSFVPLQMGHNSFRGADHIRLWRTAQQDESHFPLAAPLLASDVKPVVNVSCHCSHDDRMWDIVGPPDFSSACSMTVYGSVNDPSPCQATHI